MDTRQLFGAFHNGTNSWVSLGPPALVRNVRRSAGLGAAQLQFHGICKNSSGNSSTRDYFSCGLRSTHIAHVAQWSSARLDPPSAPLGKRLPVKPGSDAVQEAHKVFDEVVIAVKSGCGGNGEVVPSGRGRYVPNHKYKPGGNQPKQIWLPASDPGDGADGGDVVLVCDPGVDSLLHLHQQQAGKGRSPGPAAKVTPGVAGTFCAPDGANANPNTGSGGPKRNKEIKKARTPALEVPVPPGTVVKRRGTGALLGELLQPGQRLTVVQGGRGGHGVVAPSRQQRKARITRAEREARNKGVELVDVEDDGWRSDSRGHPGQQLTLTLLLRVVADVGLVGFPNAGKSSLLKALTRASPTIAPYPFTTLMPNLGVMSAGGGATRAVLADLPGLIEGAHKGRGLGRNFLRHLRRTRALLHVVDASSPDPATDYYAVREELRMYNPEYCARPHVVALNKTDLLLPLPASSASLEQQPGRFEQEQQQQREGVAQLVSAIREAARRQAAEHKEGSYEGPTPRGPLAVVPCSAAAGEGLKELAVALQRAIGISYISEPDILRPAPDTLAAARGLSNTNTDADTVAEETVVDDTAAAATTAAIAAAAAATATATAAATVPTAPGSSSCPRGLPPPPPAGWDDEGDVQAADAATWGRSGPFDDAAAELEDGEMERLTAQCRELGLMDERGNFLSREWAGDPGAPGRINDVLDDQELSFLDEHSLPGAAPGDGAADDDEWVELSSLDEQTLAAVLVELERGGSGGVRQWGADADSQEPLLDLDRDFRLAPGKPIKEEPRLEHHYHHPHHHEVSGCAVEGNRVEVSKAEGAESEESTRAQQQRSLEAEEERAVEEEGEGEGEELVRMAPSDDPDAQLLTLSLEQLLALEKDW